MSIGKDWSGKVAVITGGATGIGLALAQALAREGMDLVLASRDPAKLEAAEAALEDSGRRVLTVACDVADRPQVYALAAQAKAAFGQVDLLCANAGTTTAGPLRDHADADWDWAIDVNLRGVTNCIQAFYPDMAERRSGTIMLTGSQTALAPDWVLNHGPYVAAKAGVMALASLLRAEAAQVGVAVSLLIPAATDTQIGPNARLVRPDAPHMTVRADALAPLAEFPFMLSPEEVAARALAGLRDNAPIIVTHAGMKPLVEDYFAKILAAYDVAARFRPERETASAGA